MTVDLALAPTPSSALWLLPALPLASAVLLFLFGRAVERRFGRAPLHAAAVGSVALSGLVAHALLWGSLQPLPEAGRSLVQTLWPLWHAGGLKLDFSLALDPLSATLVLVITHVGALVHLYATAYMAGEGGAARFFALLNLFVAAMLMLVLAGNLVVLFAGWEGVGFCSYGLIGFWYRDRVKAAAAAKAFVVNRVGDLGFVLGMALLFSALATAGSPRPGSAAPLASAALSDPGGRISARGVPLGATLDFAGLRAQLRDPAGGVAEHLARVEVGGLSLVTWIALCFLLAACGKSAQLPLHIWLPDAMAGPTPVSALIHAATLVTAGVYLLARLDFLFALSPTAMMVTATIGATTALLGATAALVQVDFKRVLAYSTISQLGFLFLGLGVGATAAALFHLVTHALFKACLFLAAGSAILASHHEQDLRQLGGLGRWMPKTQRAHLFAAFALAGLPWASGFYSKDAILARALASPFGPTASAALFCAGLCAALLTAFYIFRAHSLAFGGQWRGHGGHRPLETSEDPHARGLHAAADHLLAGAASGSPTVVPEPAPPSAPAAPAPHESPWPMTTVLGLLGAGSLLSGLVLGFPAAWRPSRAPGLLEQFLHPALAAAAAPEEPRALALAVQLASAAVALIGAGLAVWLYRRGPNARLGALRARAPRLWALLYDAWGFDLWARKLAAAGLRGAHLVDGFDRNGVDRLVHLTATASRALSFADDAFDRVVVDGAIHGLARLFRGLGSSARQLQNGRVQSYVAYAAAGGLVLAFLLTALL